jgi:SAM-dependent methyltransferase
MGSSSSYAKSNSLSLQERQTLQTYNATATSYDASHKDKAVWLVEMRRFYELLPEGNILEIGSGTGRDARILTSLGYEYTGVDASPSFVAMTQKLLPDERFHEMSVYQLASLGHKKFDGFWTAATLLHVPKSRIDESLQNIRAVTRPGGIGFSSLKDGVGEKIEAKSLNDVVHRRFFAYWHREEFVHVLERNGYKLVDYTHHTLKDATVWHCFLVEVDEGR